MREKILKFVHHKRSLDMLVAGMVKEAEVLIPQKEVFPAKINPMMSIKAERLPADLKNWIAEFKWDGLRALVRIDQENGQFAIISKTGRNIAENFPEFQKGFQTLVQKRSLILDGEIVFIDGKKGRGAITQARSQAKAPQIDPQFNPLRCRFFVFDLLYWDGENLLNKPLLERKRKLSKLLSKNFQNEHGIAVTPYFLRDHEVVLQAAKEQGFEGIVLKRKTSHYLQRQTREWLKIKFND